MNFKKLNLNSNNDNIGNRNHLVQRLPHLHSHNISRGKPRVPHLHNHAHHHGHHHNHHHQQNHNHNHLTVSNNVAALGRSTTNSSTPGSSSSSSSSSASSPGYSSSDLHSDNESKYKIKNEYDELDLSAAQFTIAKPCKWVNKDGDVDTINDENNDDSHEHDDEKFESKCDGFNFHSNDELYKHLLEDHIQHNHDHHHHHDDEQQDAKPVVKKEEDGDTHLFNNDEHVYSCEWLGCMFSSNRLEDLLDHVPKSHGFTSDMIKKSENDFILTETGNYIPKLKSQIKSENNNNGTGNNGLDVVDEDDHDCSEECHHVCEWITNQTEVTQNGATPIKCGEVFKETGDLTNHIINKHIGSGKSKYTCCWSECPRNCKEFSQRQKIIRHLHTHTKHKPFICLECGKKFSLELMLKQHVRTHTGEKPYKCNQCGKFFKTSSSLTIHSRTHTGEKPLICKICGKGFNESSNLNKHMKIHDRNFKCSYCLRSFDNEIKLTNHVKNCKKSKSSTTTTTTTASTTASNSSSSVSLNSSKTVSDSLTT
ncbi:unnamed protein product [[Candida] boidinii]|uniref:Unnamed protein product n=1 Tax=Candida boidinii TaxID=5477 RepID=A0ACB5U157_CANBO|nr:unnamed protein product [[Candida] boidinii]